MKFSKKAFCKTCHIADHLQECYNLGHQINDPPYIVIKNIVEESFEDHPSGNMDMKEFEGIKN